MDWGFLVVQSSNKANLQIKLRASQLLPSLVQYMKT
jgi:hypothetical protein